MKKGKKKPTDDIAVGIEMYVSNNIKLILDGEFYIIYDKGNDICGYGRDIESAKISFLVNSEAYLDDIIKDLDI